MAITTPNMGLTKWDQGSDPYSHTQLATNFNLIDLHDHTANKGVQIPTDGIEDGAITTVKLAADSVTGDKIADGAVTSDQLDKSYVHPLGSILLWWRPNGLTAVPTGWVIAQGQTLSAAQHDFSGGGNITLPNMDQAFLMAVTNVSNIGVLGGSSTINLAHTHSVNGHTHTIDPHTHSETAHAHNFGGLTDLKDAMNTQLGGAGSEWVHAEGGPDAGHSHGYTGVTEVSSGGTTGSTGLTTNSGSGSTNSQLSSATSIIPPNVAVLPLLRVKL
jgi:hypothetical protein